MIDWLLVAETKAGLEESMALFEASMATMKFMLHPTKKEGPVQKIDTSVTLQT